MLALMLCCGARRFVPAELVAEACADGDLVAAFGAAAVEDGGAGFGLHAREEAVGLGAVAAVGLKGTLGHHLLLVRFPLIPSSRGAMSRVRGLLDCRKSLSREVLSIREKAAMRQAKGLWRRGFGDALQRAQDA